MSRAIRFYKTGGPEVLVWEEVEVGKPGPGEVRVRHVAVGVNFIDIYIRRACTPRHCRAASAPRRLGGSRKSVLA
jgi:NADPH:quinone reductase